MKTPFFALIAVLALLPARLAADAAPEPLTTGGTNLMAREGKVPVEMTWEVVDLWPGVKKNRCEVVFEFTNCSDEVQEFEVGFPSLFRQKLHDFKVDIDGRKQIYEIKTEGKNRRGQPFKYWLCWTMKFEPKGTRRVKVSYWTDTETWKDFEKRLPADITGKFGTCMSGYVLRTGRYWKNAIGKATIRIHHDEIDRSRFEGFKWDGWIYDADKNLSQIVHENLEPDYSSDIHYRFRASTPQQEMKILEDLSRRQPVHPQVQKYMISKIKEDESLSNGARDKAVRTLIERFLIEHPSDSHDEHGPNWNDYTLKLATYLYNVYEAEDNTEAIARLRTNLRKFAEIESAYTKKRRVDINSKHNRWKTRRLQELDVREARLRKVMGTDTRG